MKSIPHSTSKPSSRQPSPKTHYRVTIDESDYDTYATTEEQAMNNAAWRYAEEEDMGIGLVLWKIKHDKLYYNIEEVD